MTDWNGVSETISFVGLVHFFKVFTEPGFLYSFLITGGYTLINVVLVNVVGFILALVVTSHLRLRNFYRAGFFAPYLIGGIVLGYIWQFLFNNALPAFGKILGSTRLRCRSSAGPTASSGPCPPSTCGSTRATSC